MTPEHLIIGTAVLGDQTLAVAGQSKPSATNVVSSTNGKFTTSNATTADSFTPGKD